MPSHQILIVEDDDDLRALYRRALALEGYTVVEANSGYAALQRMDVQPPSLVILDLILPGYDGLAVLRDISAQPHLRAVPVLVVTGSSLFVDPSRVAGVLRKPVAPARLLQAIQQCLSAGDSVA